MNYCRCRCLFYPLLNNMTITQTSDLTETVARSALFCRARTQTKTSDFCCCVLTSNVTKVCRLVLEHRVRQPQPKYMIFTFHSIHGLVFFFIPFLFTYRVFSGVPVWLKLCQKEISVHLGPMFSISTGLT